MSLLTRVLADAGSIRQLLRLPFEEDARIATVGDGPLQDGAGVGSCIASAQDDQVSKLRAKSGPCTLQGLQVWVEGGSPLHFVKKCRLRRVRDDKAVELKMQAVMSGE